MTLNSPLKNKIKSGVYQILNKINGKLYVGSAINIKNRWNAHKNDLRGNRHYNTHLQNSYNKYGENGFEFSVIERVEDTTHLIEREQFWMDTLKVVEKGYNMCPVAYRCMTGRKHSEETKQKMSESQLGEKNHQYGKKGKDCVRSKMITFNGKTQNITGWAKELGIHRTSLGQRLNSGQPLEKALNVSLQIPRRLGGTEHPNATSITYKGETFNMTGWSKKIGISLATLIYRLKNWTLEKALTTPKIH
ncbi:MAG: GIY-YIG nuclease family protein [Candidatus Peribacteraceae bacterium]|nr:GIY-YIG nuclease family protein [Candidatus Peribacteraceae bacterium]